MKKRLRLAIAAIAAVSLVAGACFQIIGFNNKLALATGEEGSVIVKLGRSGIDSTNYAFLIIGVTDELTINGISKFDLKGKFGGPYDKSKRNDIRNVVLTNGACNLQSGGDVEDYESDFDEWALYVTDSKVDSTDGAKGKFMKVKVNIARVGGADNGTGNFIIVAGAWTDASVVDGLATAAELYCTNFVGGQILLVAP